MTILRAKFISSLSFLILGGAPSLCLGMDAPHLDNMKPDLQVAVNPEKDRLTKQFLILALSVPPTEEASVLGNLEIQAYPEIDNKYLNYFDQDLMRIDEFKQYCIEPLKLIINSPDLINKISPELLGSYADLIDQKFTKHFIYLINLVEDNPKKSHLSIAFSKLFFVSLVNFCRKDVCDFKKITYFPSKIFFPMINNSVSFVQFLLVRNHINKLYNYIYTRGVTRKSLNAKDYYDYLDEIQKDFNHTFNFTEDFGRSYKKKRPKPEHPQKHYVENKRPRVDDARPVPQVQDIQAVPPAPDKPRKKRFMDEIREMVGQILKSHYEVPAPATPPAPAEAVLQEIPNPQVPQAGAFQYGPKPPAPQPVVPPQGNINPVIHHPFGFPQVMNPQAPQPGALQHVLKPPVLPHLAFQRGQAPLAPQGVVIQGDPKPSEPARQIAVVKRLRTREGYTYFKNNTGAIFYGDLTQARSATHEQRQKLTEIFNQLIELRFNKQINEENYKIAYGVLEVIGTAIKENRQICKELFKKFSENHQNYIQYSLEPRVVIHCEQRDMPAQDRTFAVYNTLALAYGFAVESNIVQDFFTHAFLDDLSGFGCLDGAQKILLNWLEANMEKIERVKNKEIKETVITDSSIFQTFAEVINESKNKTIINGLDHLTYNQYMEKLKAEQSFQQLEKEKQNIQIMRAEEIFYGELEENIRVNVLEKLLNLKYEVDIEAIERCWTILRGE
ncbi:MAG: hypothetical protein K0M45_08620 [Candidatus Paracaedibacteraceae bacterium]|nr:hypothetical protein [Candidatus Paracaedibacteraceae bacterium]